MYTTIELEIQDGIANIYLNRPAVKNAFNEQMIFELKDCFTQLNQNNDVRIIIIRGKGTAFCAGADLHWMKSIRTKDLEANLEESQLLADCLHTIYCCLKPVISIAHGYSMGGANGIISACDIVYTLDTTVFSLSEVKLGLIPSCIAPYILKRIGEFAAREIMLTGKRITGKEAMEIGLVNKSFADVDSLEEYLDDTISHLQSGGIEAQKNIKLLIHQIVNHLSLEQARLYTAQMIAETRMTAEAQEGMNAFLEKRTPQWNKNDKD
jgi:methylglutaconyl-CoA hydratase